ncbi:MAG: sigma 54-interacting transcriptional regulator [Oscillospiraceae bacterium]|nr:sigma 54-interacting transcriptional regulator [Oscillospiraceae bacterium]
MLHISEDARRVFNAMREGILIIDTDGVIVFGNTAYRRFLTREGGGEDIGDVAGYVLRDLRPNARLPEVLKTCRPILQEPRREEGDLYFVNMYPVLAEDGETLLGGLSVVTFMEDATAFRDMLQTTKNRSRQMLYRISKAEHSFHTLVARGEKSVACRDFARRVAHSDATVLLTGESGVGKDVFAQAIHNESPRNHGVYTAINCATFNPDTLDSELFGYVGGAFPGARPEGKVGLFEAAEGGTLLLDEISEMKPEIQSKLLRTLQEHTIRPVGSVEEIPVNVRILAASSADLEQCMREGRFRPDLYYRLNTFRIHIPPLRERMEDLPFLVRQFLGEISASMKRTIAIAPDAMMQLQLHDWPGNVRELRNVLEFSTFLCDSDGVIHRQLLPAHVGAAQWRDNTTLYERTRRFERAEIDKALQYYGDDLKGKKAAAAELGISLASLYSKLKER